MISSSFSPAPQNDKSMIEAVHITKKYGRRTILRDISFSARAGERVALVGRNGCGKTTLMQILSGSMRPNGGQLLFFGEEPLKKPRLFREYCGYVPQEAPLLGELSVKDNLKLWGVHKSRNFQYILDRFELKDIMKVEVRKLSGGMKKRLSIACAIAAWPPVLLLDEPTTALDLYYKETIREWLTEYKSRDGIVLLSTHEEAEILSCDRCLMLRDGIVTEIEKDGGMIGRIRELMNDDEEKKA